MRDLHTRFQKLALGIRMIQEHNEREESSDRQNVVAEVSKSAQKNIGGVLAILDEFYQVLAANGWDLSDIPSVDESVNPNWDYYQDNRIFHHYVILKEFVNHLKFSDDLVQEFTKDEVQPKLPSTEGVEK